MSTTTNSGAVRRSSRPRRSVLAVRIALLTSLTAGIAGACSQSSDAAQVRPTEARTTADPAAAPRGGASHGAGHEAVDVPWGPAPAVFPAGAELAVMNGDPSVAGALFTVRLRLPNGYVIPPHFHPADEHVTVLQGTLVVGLGNAVTEESVAATLPAGGFITAPENANHWSRARGRTVVQVHGVGPFQITYVDANGAPLPQ